MKNIRKVISLLTAALLAVCCFSSCRKTETATELKVNAASLAVKSAEDCAGKSEILLTLSERAKVNFVEIECDSDAVTSFTVYGSKLDMDIPLSGGDTVGRYRFMYFEPFETKTVKLVINSAEGEYNITSFCAGYCEMPQNDFRLVSYLPCEDFTADNQPDAERIAVSTDIILFGIADFDDGGVINVTNYDMERIIENIRTVNPDARVLLNIASPESDAPGTENAVSAVEKQNKAFETNREMFVNNVNSCFLQYNIDGIIFDYEPSPEKRDMRLFSEFLTALNKTLPSDKIIGAAVKYDSCGLSDTAKEALDYVIVSAYDDYDALGRHSTFTCAYNAVSEFINAGYPASKLILGVPLFGRPLDKSDYTLSYADYAQSLEDFTDTVSADCGGQQKECYFNSLGLLRDKTAFSVMVGLGGVTPVRMNDDAEFSSDGSYYAMFGELF